MQAHLVKESVARAILIDAALEVYYQGRRKATDDQAEETLWRNLCEALRGLELWICRVYHCGFPPAQADERFMEDQAQRLGLGSQAPSEIIDRVLARGGSNA
jgi:hypothetical protein